MNVKKKESTATLAPVMDRAQLLDEIESLSSSLATVKKLLALNIGTKDGKGRNMTAVAQFFAAQLRIESSLSARKAELRQIDGSGEVIDPESVTREMVAAVESGDWPIPLVEQLYLACRRVLHIEEHLPEAPAAQWH